MAITNLKKTRNRKSWSIKRSRDLYRILIWSDGYFDINNRGHMIALPDNQHGSEIDIYQLVLELQEKGYPVPILIRFSNILKQRIVELCNAFSEAMQENNYQSGYTAVYPIKVNQQRKVIEDIISHGDTRIGLEAGSKPELLIIIALARKDSIVICNGYKDSEYLRLALIAQQLGMRVFIVIEKLSELDEIIKISDEMQIKPRLGLRVRLASVAAGKWQNTGGEKSKFGLHPVQVYQAIKKLKKAGLLNNLELAHFHVGSQVSNIQQFKRALTEGTRFYSEIIKLGANLNYIDVGGGIGIDYEGSRSQNFNSINYDLKSYADTVVGAIKEICDQHQLSHPVIITESGRAMTAHHAMLVTNVIDVEQAPGESITISRTTDAHPVVSDMFNILDSIDVQKIVQTFYDTEEIYVKAKEMFSLGMIDLKTRAQVEEIYFHICRKILPLIQSDQKELIDQLNSKLTDKYICNFSLFQSLPDCWAIDQVFPIVPLHRLDELPDKRVVINDLTCDSDGCIDLYVASDEIDTNLPLHDTIPDEVYLIGVFLIGAYQEILGDMHNLFGDTASINIEVNENGEYSLSEYHSGDTVADLLEYVHINVEALETIYKEKIKNTSLEIRESYLDELLQGLQGYTYLED